MDIDETEKLFPGVKDKIAAPKKQSAFAKEKQAAEEKRREDEAANAALLKTFEASFDADNNDDGYDSRTRGAYTGQRDSTRDGWTPGRRSGLGSLGPVPAMRHQAPPSMKRKRALDEMRDLEAARREENYEHRTSSPRDKPASRSQQEEHDAYMPRPTIHLTSLPPGMTSQQLKAILSPLLNVHSVRFHPPVEPQGDRRTSVSAVATLAPETTPKQIDMAVNQLRDRYVGCGFTMTASRLAPIAKFHANNALDKDQPFGAQRVQQRTSLKMAPPPGEHNRFAPPDSYERSGSLRRETELDLDKTLDVHTLRAIHTIVDRLLTEEDSVKALRTEALLMSLPEVQNDERFAFLYDSRSVAGLYYRYCLWTPGEEGHLKAQMTDPERIFEDIYTRWRAPSKRTPFAGLTDLSYAVKDVDYVSSDEESDDDRPQVPNFDAAGDDTKAKISITPLQRARLTHLLARLPTSNTKLRRGDVARVTNFAIRHAVDGVEEIVDMLLLNVDKPFSLSLAARYDRDDDDDVLMDERDRSDDEYNPEDPLLMDESARPAASEITTADDGRDADPSNAKLVALYVISDILGAIGSAEGAKNAWKYRQLIEAGFRHQKTFERLGTLDRELSWGKMKAEQWKRRIASLLDIWEKSSSFSSDIIQALKAAFNGEAVGDLDIATGTTEPGNDDTGVAKMPKWMASFKKVDQDVDADAKDNLQINRAISKASEASVKNATVKLLDQDVLVESKAPPGIKGSSTSTSSTRENEDKSHLAAESNIDQSRLTAQSDEAEQKPSPVPLPSDTVKPSNSTAPKRRMRAEDMFADSDEE